MFEHISVPADQGRFAALLARSAAGAAPAVVVLQEIFGVNQDMRLTCNWLAEEGFNALCPDLFWRLEAGVEMTDRTKEEWKRAVKLYEAYDFDQGVEDIRAVVDLARGMPGGNGKVGILGYCLGGLMTFRYAARYEVDAAVAYYGGGTDKYLDEADGLRCPMLIHLAGEDEYLPAAAQTKIRAALADKKDAVIHTYAGRQHAFARREGVHFDADAATLANGRSLNFLRKHLF